MTVRVLLKRQAVADTLQQHVLHYLRLSSSDAVKAYYAKN
jgi:hypothetical protein